MDVVMHSDEARTNGAEAGSIVERAKRVAALAARRAASLDADGQFPVDDIRELYLAGLLTAPFPVVSGGEGLGIGDPDRLRRTLIAIGRGNLALGRLYEGHVNAVVLVARYGTAANLELLKQEADAGSPSGVWMAGESLRLKHTRGRQTLHGRKILCSGAGHFRRPLVAADRDDGSVMLIPYLDRSDRGDASGWTAQGMQATATGDVSSRGS